MNLGVLFTYCQNSGKNYNLGYEKKWSLINCMNCNSVFFFINNMNCNIVFLIHKRFLDFIGSKSAMKLLDASSLADSFSNACHAKLAKEVMHNPSQIKFLLGRYYVPLAEANICDNTYLLLSTYASFYLETIQL